MQYTTLPNTKSSYVIKECGQCDGIHQILAIAPFNKVNGAQKVAKIFIPTNHRLFIPIKICVLYSMPSLLITYVLIHPICVQLTILLD